MAFEQFKKLMAFEQFKKLMDNDDPLTVEQILPAITYGSITALCFQPGRNFWIDNLDEFFPDDDGFTVLIELGQELISNPNMVKVPFLGKPDDCLIYQIKWS